MEKEAALQVLEGLGYKCLAPLRVSEYQEKATTEYVKQVQDGMFLGKVIDTETTGLEKDAQIFEIGITLFLYDKDQNVTFVNTLEMFEEPTVPIPQDVTTITGRTLEDVRGKAFPEEVIQNIFTKPGIVIAHNASFDRPKLEKRFPIFQKCAWACTQRDLQWLQKYKQVDTKLRLLVEDVVGKYFHGHHATDDTLATFEVLLQNSPFEKTYFQELMLAAKVPTLRVYAVDTPYAKKEIVKSLGYRWNDQHKMYSKDIEHDAYDAEKKDIEDAVYKYTLSPNEFPCTKVTAANRYSERICPPQDFLHHVYPYNPRKGQRIRDIAKESPSDLKWAVSNISQMSDDMRRSIQFWLNQK